MHQLEIFMANRNQFGQSDSQRPFSNRYQDYDDSRRANSDEDNFGRFGSSEDSDITRYEDNSGSSNYAGSGNYDRVDYAQSGSGGSTGQNRYGQSDSSQGNYSQPNYMQDRGNYASGGMGSSGYGSSGMGSSNYGSGNVGSSGSGSSGSGSSGYGWSGYGSSSRGSYGSGRGDSNYSGYGQPSWNEPSGEGQQYGQSGGGSQGMHRGKGPKGYQRSDERIKELISERLSDDGDVDASEVTINVQGGKVTLEGSVDSRRTKNRVEDIAEQCGVQDVQNNLKVNRSGDQSAASTATTSSNGKSGTGSSSSATGAGRTSGSSDDQDGSSRSKRS
jgi:osmotically-inducible protein OsmY